MNLGSPKVEEVVAYLRPGVNEVRVRCRNNTPGPTGVCLKVVASSYDGEVYVLTSDDRSIAESADAVAPPKATRAAPIVHRRVITISSFWGICSRPSDCRANGGMRSSGAAPHGLRLRMLRLIARDIVETRRWH